MFSKYLEEKKRQEEIKAEHEAYQTECFAMVEGTWEDEDGTVRVEFYYDDGDRMVSVYEKSDIISLLLCREI